LHDRILIIGETTGLVDLELEKMVVDEKLPAQQKREMKYFCNSATCKKK